LDSANEKSGFEPTPDRMVRDFISMELKPDIDRQIQIELCANGITFPVDAKGRIAIHEYRMDTKAGAGMLYILPDSKLPNGKLRFLVAPANYVYGVFYFDKQAAIVEVSSMALDGEIEDWYINNRR
jgi:hypothetical protein